ncbi:hypothetical protein [Gemmatimonas sp. UBA7669]|uniref:hypothetical protein n=1 Tax=Gemmatimonas sp. UBA7669 TaxID=1946568 RepID=UPI0025C0AC44|nr:hypothetical protein [Gemmatimonas sp. UBA7669]
MRPAWWSDPLPWVVVGLAAAVLAWNVALAGWIASRREAPRLFTQLTAFCGLLVVPSVVIGVASGFEAGARTISGITWLLPVVTLAFALQVLYALLRRLVSPLVALPLLLYDGVLVAVSLGDYLVTTTGEAPLALQAAVAARDVVVGLTVGRTALASPLALLVPMVAPAYPARWKLSGAVRAVLVLIATALTTLLVLEWPRGVAAVRSYREAQVEPMQARPAGDFAVGLRLYPTLSGAPTERRQRLDTRLVEAFGPDVVLVVLQSDPLGAAGLDALARSLDALRQDSVQLAVAVSLGRLPDAPDSPERLAYLARILERLKPDILFPALGEPLPSWIAAPPPSSDWWRALLIRSAALVQRMRPRTVLAWSAARLDATDSSVYAWATAPGAPVEMIGAMVYPSFSGLPGVDARLRALTRWHDAAVGRRTDGRALPPHWLVHVGGLPAAHGDDAQTIAMRRSLAFATRQSWINGAIVGEPSDDRGQLGLRAANGRERDAVQAIGLAMRRFTEARARR